MSVAPLCLMMLPESWALYHDCTSAESPFTSCDVLPHAAALISGQQPKYECCATFICSAACTATESICDLCMHYMQSTLGQNLDPDWTATGSFQHHSHTFAIEWHCLARPHRVAKLTVMVTIWSTVYCVCDMYACITRKMNDLTEKRRHAVQQAAACRTCLKPLLKCRFVQTHAAHAYAYSWSCHCLRMHHVQFCRVCWLTMMFVCLDQVPRLVLQHRERHMPSSLDHVMGD